MGTRSPNRHSASEPDPQGVSDAGAEPDTGFEAIAKTGGIRLRAIGIGIVMSALIVGMTQALSIERSAAEVGGGAPAPTPTYLLFLYVLLATPLAGLLHRRLALSRGETLLIYTMMLIAGPITHPYAIGFLIPHTVSP